MSLPNNQPRVGTTLPRRLALSLLLIICAASLVRLVDVERMVVWHDEVYTAVRVLGFAQKDLGPALFDGRLLAPDQLLRIQTPSPDHTWCDTLRALGRHPEHGPLYYLTARLATQWVDSPILALRGTSALIGLLLAPAVFWLMRELFGAGKAPWIAATLAAVSPFQLLYAQEARQYALWTLLVAATAAALLHALRTGRTRDWWAYGALVTVGLYSHLLFLLMLPVHGLYLLMARRAGPGSHDRVGRPWLAATGVAVALLSPWLALLAMRSDAVQQYIAWMERPVQTLKLLQAWGQHLTRLFVDPAPSHPGWLLLGLLPLAWALGRFCAAAPRPARWLPCLLIGVSVAAVLGPDLLAGGSRSLHARYTLPALLAVQLAVAWVLAAEWDAPSSRRRIAAMLVFATLIGLGGWSGARILQADTWWTKNFSRENAAIARMINAGDRPLVLASSSGVSVGELISLAYHLRPGVALWGEPHGKPYDLPDGFGDLFALTPSPQLRERLERTHRLVPLRGTWQWYRVEPKARHAERAVERQRSIPSASDADAAPPPGHSQ